MCFYPDYEWIAEVHSASYCRLGEQANCLECGRVIDGGEWRKVIEQQEYEECRVCEDEWSDDYDESIDTEACEHDYGETFSGTICRECLLLLAAIYDLEEKEGCPEDARQPAYGDLGEEMCQDRNWGDNKYAAHAVALYPELARHPFCGDAQLQER